MNIDEIRNAILATHPNPDTKGRAFQVTFYKTTGERRTMRARLGMKVGLTGRGQSYDPADHDLITVWELNNNYRNIPLGRLVSLRVPDRHKHLREVLHGATIRHTTPPVVTHW
jgi:hypothetical protein